MTAIQTLKKSIASAAFTLTDALGFRRAANITTDQPGLANYQDSIGRPDVALQLGTVWACIRLIAETIATLPLITYKNVGDRRLVATEHPLYSILHDSPNADMTAVEFWEAVVAQLCLHGNAYCYKTYNSQGAIISLDPMCWEQVGLPRRMPNGTIIYPYRGQELTDAEVWHIKGFGTNGLMGISPIRAGILSMAAARNADRAAATTFGNNMKPHAVMLAKEFLTPDQRTQMKAAVSSGVFEGAPGERIRLVEGGMTYEQLSLSPEDAQLLETRTFQVEDLCRWFSVNPALVGHPGTASNFGTGQEQIMLNFLQFTLRPYLVRIEQGIKKSLMTPVERTKYFAEYSVEGLLRADSKTRIAVYAQQVQNGLKTRNECRALENDAPLPGGDELTVQSNLIPVTLLGKITSTTQPVPPAEPDKPAAD